MSSFTNHSVAKQGYHKIHVKRGESFAVVSGLGGDSIRSWYKDLHWAKWWASTAALDNGVNYGALLCTLQEPSLFEGNCEFRDIDGNVWDRFRVSVEEPRKKVGKTVPIQSDTSAQNTRLRVQFTTGPNENSTPLTVLIPVNCPPSRILTIQNQKTRRCAHHKEFQISHSSLTGSLEWTSPEIPRISLVTDQDEQVTVTFKTDSGDWSVESLEWV